MRARRADASKTRTSVPGRSLRGCVVRRRRRRKTPALLRRSVRPLDRCAGDAVAAASTSSCVLQSPGSARARAAISRTALSATVFQPRPHDVLGRAATMTCSSRRARRIRTTRKPTRQAEEEPHVSAKPDPGQRSDEREVPFRECMAEEENGQKGDAEEDAERHRRAACRRSLRSAAGMPMIAPLTDATSSTPGTARHPMTAPIMASIFTSPSPIPSTRRSEPVGADDGQRNGRAEERAEERVEQRVGQHQVRMEHAEAERAGAESDGDAGKVDDVGQDLDVGVDVDERDRHRDDRGDDDEGDGRPGAEKDREIEERVGQLDERIAPGDPAPHARQRPRSTRKLRTGMLSYQRMAASHCGQWLPGKTIDSSRG